MTNVVFFIDTETGGLDPKEHSLLSVSICRLDVLEHKVTDEFTQLIKHPVYRVTPKALSVNGIDLVKHDSNPNALYPEDAVFEMRKWLCAYLPSYTPKYYERLIAGGHNLSFDIAFIKELGLGWDNLFQYRTIDTQIIATFLQMVGMLSIKGTGLSVLIKHFQVEVSEEERHTSLGDVKATADVFLEMYELVRHLQLEDDARDSL